MDVWKCTYECPKRNPDRKYQVTSNSEQTFKNPGSALPLLQLEEYLTFFRRPFEHAKLENPHLEKYTKGYTGQTLLETNNSVKSLRRTGERPR